MKKLAILILIIYVYTSAIAQSSWRKDEMEIRIKIENQSQAKALQSLRLNGDVYPDGSGLFYVVPSELEKIKNTGIKYDILKENLNAYYKDFWKSREEYHDYYDMVALTDSLAEHFPQICKKTICGYSILGNELGLLKISDNVATDENEPEVMFDGGIHGDEIVGPENCVRFARHLCLEYNSDPDITELINTREIFFYYMVNPDGRINMVRTNHNNVDLNRDWSYMWDGWGESPGAASQIETQVFRDVVYDNQITVQISFHGGTEIALYPWGYSESPIQDYVHNDHLTWLYSSTSGYANLQYGQSSTTLYYTNGSSVDYNYGIMGSAGMTVELSYDKQPPESQIIYFYSINEPAMMEMIRQAGFGLGGTVKDALTGQAIGAVILVDDFWPAYADPVVGDYHKYVLAGTYTIKVIANGYEPQVVDNIVVGDESSTVTDFELYPAEGQYIYRVVACQIPNNNTYDESFTAGVIGEPDGINYSIGKNGWVIVDMQYPLANGPGNDIIIYEGDETPEDFTCYISSEMDGPWTLFGTGTGTTAFDLNSINIFFPRFIKIVDDGDGAANQDNAGYDLDAIESIAVPNKVINPDPDDGQNNIEPFAQLSWDKGTGGNSTYFRIFFGTDNPPTNIINGDSIITTTFIPPDLMDFDTFYYWRVDACNGYGSTTGDIWSLHTVRAPDEDFETGNFSSHRWLFEGDAEWTIDGTVAYSGIYSARSGIIGNNQSTSLKIELDVEGIFNTQISFSRMVQSDISDKLQFYIDGILQGEWGGLKAFIKVTYPVDDGLHTFEWRYVKDASGSSGGDCAWIDYIYFPPLAPPTAFAGNDTSVCEGSALQLAAYATNYDSLVWSSSGTGVFIDPTLADALYTPSEDDILTGSVIVTLTVFAGKEILTDDLTLTFDPFPSVPAKPDGPDYIDLFYTSETEYSIVGGATAYEWEILPQEAGTINGSGTTIAIIWNGTFLGSANLHVRGINDCGMSDFSDNLEILIVNTIGIPAQGLDARELQIIPNPNNGNFRIKMTYPTGTIDRINILNTTGKIICSLRDIPVHDAITNELHLRSIPDGCYYLYIMDRDWYCIKKFLVMH
jgi:hypothetical protein